MTQLLFLWVVLYRSFFRGKQISQMKTWSRNLPVRRFISRNGSVVLFPLQLRSFDFVDGLRICEIHEICIPRKKDLIWYFVVASLVW